LPVPNVLCWSPDGRTLASAGGARHISLWDIDAGVCTNVPAHSANIRLLAFTPCGTWLVSSASDADRTVRVWSAAARSDGTHECTHVIHTEPFMNYKIDAITALAVSPCGRCVIEVEIAI
jgi:WD40 repeat protein